MPISVNWGTVFEQIVEWVEKNLDVSLIIDDEILQEANVFTSNSIASYKLDSPNLAKIAGCIAFWIRKLKPISFGPDKKNKILCVNELVALLVGLSIYNSVKDGEAPKGIQVSGRVLIDWIITLRYNSHSPHSTALAFELLSDTK